MTVLHIGTGDRDREVSVHSGDRVVLRLPENPTTGFRWAGEFPPFLALDADFNEPGMAPGEAGFRVLELTVRSPAHGEINLVLGRAWEADRPPGARFRVILDAR